MSAFYRYIFSKKIPGRARLVRLLGWEGIFLKLGEFELFLDPYDYVDSQILENGYYELHVLETILDCAENEDVFWDIGGNIGLHSFSLKNRRPDMLVFCFEPNPRSMAKIMKSRKRNSLEINVVSCALSSENSVAELSILSSGNSGLSSLTPWENVQYDDSCFVPLIRAENLIDSGFSVPNIVKLDVEGHEFDVLKGFGDYLEHSSLRLIVLEDNRNDDVNNLLLVSGFKLKRIAEKEIIAFR